jgi:molybdate transport system substrate-binding protein
MSRIIRVVASVALGLGISAQQARAEEIRVFSGGAPQVPLSALVPQFERATGHRVQFTFALVTEIQERLANGEKADLIFLPVPLIAATEKTLALRPEARRVLARVGIAVIAREGATPPDIATPEAVRKLLAESRSVALSGPDTPAGGHLGRMITQLGLDDVVRPKQILKAAIHGGAELVADGKAEIGLYLLSEVRSAKGVQVVGLLPSTLQNFVVYGTAIPVSNAKPEAAASLVEFLTRPGQRESWNAAGFELVNSGQ